MQLPTLWQLQPLLRGSGQLPHLTVALIAFYYFVQATVLWGLWPLRRGVCAQLPARLLLSSFLCFRSAQSALAFNFCCLFVRHALNGGMYPCSLTRPGLSAGLVDFAGLFLNLPPGAEHVSCTVLSLFSPALKRIELPVLRTRKLCSVLFGWLKASRSSLLSPGSAGFPLHGVRH